MSATLEREPAGSRQDWVDPKYALWLLSGAVPAHFANRRWLLEVARSGKEARTPAITSSRTLSWFCCGNIAGVMHEVWNAT